VQSDIRASAAPPLRARFAFQARKVAAKDVMSSLCAFADARWQKPEAGNASDRKRSDRLLIALLFLFPSLFFPGFPVL
jgi:hypothetical protein